MPAVDAVAVDFQTGYFSFSQGIEERFDPSAPLAASPMGKMDNSIRLSLVDEAEDLFHPVMDRSEKRIAEHFAGQTFMRGVGIQLGPVDLTQLISCYMHVPLPFHVYNLVSRHVWIGQKPDQAWHLAFGICFVLFSLQLCCQVLIAIAGKAGAHHQQGAQMQGKGQMAGKGASRPGPELIHPVHELSSAVTQGEDTFPVCEAGPWLSAQLKQGVLQLLKLCGQIGYGLGGGFLRYVQEEIGTVGAQGQLFKGLVLSVAEMGGPDNQGVLRQIPFQGRPQGGPMEGAGVPGKTLILCGFQADRGHVGSGQDGGQELGEHGSGLIKMQKLGRDQKSGQHGQAGTFKALTEQPCRLIPDAVLHRPSPAAPDRRAPQVGADQPLGIHAPHCRIHFSFHTRVSKKA